MASNRLELILSAKTKDANDALKQFDRQVDDTMGALKSKAQEAGLALGGLAIAGAAMTKSFISEANQMQKYEATLKAVTGSTEAARAELEKLVKFAADAPAFDLKGVMEAGVKMRALKVDVDRFLPLAGDLAATFDRSLPDAAQALAKALSGSQDGLTMLADSFGVAKKELIAFGAATKGDAIDVTQVDKLQDALHKVISTKYGGVMMAQSQQAAGAFASLEDAISRLKAAMGAELIEGFAGAARALTGVVEAAERLPGPTKAMIAQAVVLGTGLAALGAAASGAIVAFGPLALAIGATGAATAAATPITIAGTKAVIAQGAAAVLATGRQIALTGAIAASVGPSVAAATAATGLGVAFRAATAAILANPVGVVVALGAAAAGLVHWYGKTVQAAEEVRAKSELAADAFRKQKEAVLLAADALRQYSGDVGKAGAALADMMKEAGKTEVDANEAIKGLLDQLKQAQETGNAELEKRIQDRIHTLTRAREALAGTQAEKDAKAAQADQAAKKAIEDRGKAIEDFKSKASASYWATAREELAALDSVMAKLGVFSKEYQELSLTRVKLAREAAKEEAEADESARQEKLAAALHEVDVLKAYGDKRLADQLVLLKRILAEENLSADERKRLELDVISTQQRLADQAAQAADKRQQEREKREKDAMQAKKDLAKLENDALQAQIKATDVTIKGLEEQLRQGKDVGAQLQEEITTRGELTQQLIEQQAAFEKIGRTAAEQAQIEKKAQAEIKAAKESTDQESDKATRSAAESRKKSTLENLKLERELLDAKAASDKHVTKQDLINVAKQRLAITEQQLRLEAEMASANATEEDKQRIATQLELDLWKARKGSVTELATATAELEKQNAELKKMREPAFKGVQSLEDMAKDLNDQWSGADKKEPPPEASTAGGGAGFSDAHLQQLATVLSPNLKIEFVVPQGRPDDGWTFRSQQT